MTDINESIEKIKLELSQILEVVDNYEDDLTSKDTEIARLEDDIDDLEDRLKNKFGNSLNDEMKTDFLLANWDKLKLEDLEKLV